MSDHDEDTLLGIALEQEAVLRLEAALDTIIADAKWYWHWGGGLGGECVVLRLKEKARAAGLKWCLDRQSCSASRKEKISRSLAKRVHEKYGYRCVTCGDHRDLCCDHIVPESKGGPTTFENLQSMCRPCNAKKGNRI